MIQSASSAQHGRFATFADFYPYYLSEHRNPACRRLHLCGTAAMLVLAALAAPTADWRVLPVVPLAGYGFARLGHFAFEKNRSATLAHPWYSLIGDFAMFRDILPGRIRF